MEEHLEMAAKTENYLDNKNILSSKINLDSLGFSASFLCAIHCAAMPMIITAISMSPFSFLANPLFEISIILLSIFVGLSSLLHGYFKHHKKISPILILLTGFSIIYMGHFIVSDQYESIVTPIGAFSVAFAHIINLRYSKSVSHKHH
ncbi:MAG: MerC domain-containing protein [Candidatus Sericytochromatia bacterium]|nr:MerC domain-containing protein [Candidatus Sericytochromatia bacterium]